MARKPFPFLIGSDPEFNLLFQNKRLNANIVLKKMCKDVDWKNMGWTTEGMKGEFGFDGCNSTGEIRPDPANTADECVENFRNIIQEAFKHIGGFSLSTLSLHSPTGGHVHLDYPNNWEPTKIKHAVQKLMSFYLPITLNENPISRAIRQHSYGNICDYKIRAHDASSSVEIRCPSAEWTTTPEIMRATIAYVGTVWNEILYHESSLRKFNKILMKNDKQLSAMHEMAMAEHPLMIELLFKQIKAAVRQFEFYDEYKKDIEFLFNPKKIITQKTESEFDLFKGWGMKRKSQKLSQTVFLSQTKIAAELNKKNLTDEFIRQITLPFNDDKNVEPYARALESRMLALDWKPKNRYYLFGVRKGIDQIIAGKENLTGISLSFGHSLAKSEEDKSAIEESVRKMIRRGTESCQRDTYVDPKKGLVVDKRETIAVGIPFDWRGEHITKTGAMLKAVWEMENGKAFTPIALPETKEPILNAGKTAGILNAEDELDLRDAEDTCSQGRDMARNAVFALERELGPTLQVAPNEINSSNITNVCAA